MEQPTIMIHDSKTGVATVYPSFEHAYDALSAEHDIPAISETTANIVQVQVSEYKDLSDQCVVIDIYDAEFETREAAAEVALNQCASLMVVARGPLFDELLEI
ncbi:MAG: hypothetical protein ABFD60_04385 [Bryobacteraceae bacterium]